MNKIPDFLLRYNKIISEKRTTEQQHKKNKLTARERIYLLLDENSFEEYGSFVDKRSKAFELEKKETFCDGVITGSGKIFGRPVFVFSQDFTIIGGSVGEMHAKKITNLQKMALASKIPIIGIKDSGGARIQEGIDALAGYGEIFQNNIESSGVIPQISLILGPCAGGAVYSPALTDFTFMTENTSFMFITGPEVIKEVTGETTSHEELGGAKIHNEVSGSVDKVYKNEVHLIEETRKLFNFLPQSCYSELPIFNFNSLNKKNNAESEFETLNNILPDNANDSYDVKDIIYTIVDSKEIFEIQPDFAKNIVICFARINNSTVGIIANQPNELAGCIDIKASRKAARFIRFCDAFNIPIITFVDTPGFLPGIEQEHNSIIKHGAKLLYAYGEATVPKITITTRKAYGGAYIVMGSKHLKTDINYAWPTAEIAVLGADAAAKILFKNEKDNKEAYQMLKNQYTKEYINPYFGAKRGYIDQIIKPSDTRNCIINSLNLLKNKSTPKNRKHDNLPL